MIRLFVAIPLPEAQRERLRKENMWNCPLSGWAILRSCRSTLKAMAEDAEHCGKILLLLLALAGLAGAAYGLLTGKLTLAAAIDFLIKFKGK